jgi:hypothetical protein
VTSARSWHREEAHDLVLYAALAVLAIVHAIVAISAGLTDDEAYYRLWALAPALSYLDHPPMVAWMIAAGQSVAGDTVLGIRLPAIVASIIGPLVLWRTARNLIGADTARFAVWAVLAMPLMAVGSVIMTPDIPSVLFWSLGLWALSELHVSRNAYWWLAVGLFAGLGLLSKYTNLFLGAGILFWLVAVPENRRWLTAWQTWAGGLLALALTTPVVIWNIQHDGASFAKQFGRAARGQGWTLAYLGEFIGAFAGLASPVLALLSMIGFAYVIRSTMRRSNASHALIAATILPFIAYFLFHALHSRVQGNWPAPLYPALAMCAALAVAAGRQRLGVAGVAIGFSFTAAIYAHAIAPLPLLAASKDPTAQMRGWPAFARAMDLLRSDSGACRIVTSSYATMAQLAFHLRDRTLVSQLDEPLRYIHLPSPEQALECPALYVELERRYAPALVGARYATVHEIGSYDRIADGQVLARYRVLLASTPRR